MNDILKKHFIVPYGYENKNNVTFINSKDGKYVYKDEKIDDKILDYLKSRSFDYMPLYLENTKCTLYKYIDNIQVPCEKKMLDLAKVVGLLHSKCTFYKEICLDDYNKLCDEINGNLSYLYGYYTDLITVIESKVFPSPSEQLLSRNISKIYDSIIINKKRLDTFQSLIKNKTKHRNTVLHNNLKLEHFISNKKGYLISWNKAKIGIPVFDIYKLYVNHCLDYDFEYVLKAYESIYPFTKDERVLFDILISMPDILSLKGSEYERCINIHNVLEKLYRSSKLTLPETSKE